MRYAKGSNRSIPREPRPFRMEWRPAQARPDTPALLEEIEAAGSPDAGTLERWLKSDDERVLAAVAREHAPALWRGDGALPCLLWAKASRDFDESGIYWTPLVDVCAEYGIRMRKKAYDRCEAALGITRRFRSMGYTIKQVEEWTRHFATPHDVIDLVTFNATSMLSEIIEEAPIIDADIVDAVYEQDGIRGAASVLRNPRLSEDGAARLGQLALESFHNPPPPMGDDDMAMDLFQHPGAIGGLVLKHLDARPQGLPRGIRLRVASMARRSEHDGERFWATSALVQMAEPVGIRLMRALGPALERWRGLAFLAAERLRRTPHVRRFLLAHTPSEAAANHVARSMRPDDDEPGLGVVRSAQDRDELVRALLTLFPLNPEAALADLVRRDEDEVRGLPIARHRFEPLLAHEDREVRRNAILALGWLG